MLSRQWAHLSRWRERSASEARRVRVVPESTAPLAETPPSSASGTFSRQREKEKHFALTKRLDRLSRSRHRSFRIGEATLRGEHRLLRVEHLERECLILVAENDWLHRCALSWRGLRSGSLPGVGAELAQTDRITQTRKQRLRQCARALRPSLQRCFDLAGLRNQRLVTLAHRRQFAVDALEQFLLRITPADAVGERLAHRGSFLGTRERLVDAEDVRLVRILRLAGRL